MFKNNVFKVSVNTKKWMKCASIRAAYTISQTFVASIGTSVVIGAVDWKYVLSASALAGIISFATSVAGIPEVGEE